MDNDDMYWDDIYDYEVIPDWNENGELPDDENETWNETDISLNF